MTPRIGFSVAVALLFLLPAPARAQAPEHSFCELFTGRFLPREIGSQDIRLCLAEIKASHPRAGAALAQLAATPYWDLGNEFETHAEGFTAADLRTALLAETNLPAPDLRPFVKERREGGGCQQLLDWSYQSNTVHGFHGDTPITDDADLLSTCALELRETHPVAWARIKDLAPAVENGALPTRDNILDAVEFEVSMAQAPRVTASSTPGQSSVSPDANLIAAAPGEPRASGWQLSMDWLKSVASLVGRMVLVVALVAAAGAGVWLLALKVRWQLPRFRSYGTTTSNPTPGLVPRKWRYADAAFRALLEQHFNPASGLFPNVSLRMSVWEMCEPFMASEKAASWQWLCREFRQTFHPERSRQMRFTDADLDEISKYFGEHIHEPLKTRARAA